MSGLLRTEADVMLETAGRVNGTNNEVQSELVRLRGVVDSVRASWRGDAFVSFDNLMERWNVSARNLQDALTSISDNIRSNANNFSNVEATSVQNIKNIGGQGLSL